MNSFDAAIYLCLFVAVFMGYKSGLLRSLATIFGYVLATPLAIVFAPRLAPLLRVRFDVNQPAAWILLFGLFALAGFALSAFLRAALGATIGHDISTPDRVAGATLGAVRVMLLAVLMVLIFDRIIPAQRQPSFLAESRLRPMLSLAGQNGLRTLPPELMTHIDRLKRERGI